MRRFNKSSRPCEVLLFVVGLYLAILPAAVFAAWSDWWSTPEQRALNLYESGNHDALIAQSPNENWTALGQFQSEDFTAASQSFENSREALKESGNSGDATTALFNQGVSQVLAGQYQQAIEHFDEVLSEAPDFSDAAHNRDIAKKLLELQDTSENSQDQNAEQDQNSESNPDSSESEQSSEGSEKNSSDGSSEEAPESENSSQSESESEQSSAESKNDDAQNNDVNSASEEQQRQEEQQARDALTAEALKEQQGSRKDAEQLMKQALESEQPLSESEQATEQILRRIPDDPRGLLRRKLEQSHRNEFPEVRDAIEPW